jgi:hypothetical protein
MSEDNRDKAATEAATDTIDESEPFLSRWSRRKAQAREGMEPGEPEPEAAADTDGGNARDPDNPGGRPDSENDSDNDGDPPPATEAAELPPLESLDEDSDYSAFLAADVAPDLRRQALRKLFHSPKFNLRDGLDDYDLDYSNPEPLGNVITAEMRHRIARELERLAARAAEGSAPDEPAVAAAAVDGPDEAPADADADPEPDKDDDRSDPA